ncbi:MAG: glycerate kinase [Kocuria sp.]|nr:glycerate kinase [Kocuria sp.]
MRIVVAPDKFKGSVTAREAAEHMGEGMRQALPDADVILLPVADGGEGTLDAAVEAGYERHEVTVTGPVGRAVDAAWARHGTEAVIEMSLASGLAALPQDAEGEPVRAPLDATSRGTGELVRAALDAGCTRIILAVGGSATTDGGAGLMAALGARLLDSAGHDLPDGGGSLSKLDRVDVTGIHPGIAEAEFVLAADVDNPLTGPRGAATVFAPQKGATERDVARLESGLLRLRDRLSSALGKSARRAADAAGAGAAGGTGYAALAVLGAIRRPGIDVVLDLVSLREAVETADLVVTGEGSLDEQSLGGKTPLGVLSVGDAADVPVVVVCGRTTLPWPLLRDTGFRAVYVLSALVDEPHDSMREAPRLLREVGGSVAREHATDMPWASDDSPEPDHSTTSL